MIPATTTAHRAPPRRTPPALRRHRRRPGRTPRGPAHRAGADHGIRRRRGEGRERRRTGPVDPRARPAPRLAHCPQRQPDRRRAHRQIDEEHPPPARPQREQVVPWAALRSPPCARPRPKAPPAPATTSPTRTTTRSSRPSPPMAGPLTPTFTGRPVAPSPPSNGVWTTWSAPESGISTCNSTRSSSATAHRPYSG
jgi:hypothetical protein